MNYWIVPSNETIFRLADFLESNDVVDWSQQNNFEVGDIVFIYTSNPYKRITYQMMVEAIDIPTSDSIPDKHFWVDFDKYKESQRNNRFVRLKLIAVAPEDSRLSFNDLKQKGLKGTLWSATKIEDSKLRDHIKNEFPIEDGEKIARICWNSNGWERPSGIEGKSQNDTYESYNGFGHEEWILDRRKIMPDGFHYAYLQPIRLPFDGTINIHLYTYTPENKKLYVGYIKNAVFVSSEESAKIWKEYKKRGWAKSMLQELKDLGLSYKGSMDFNIKFRFDDFVDYTNRKIFISKNDSNTQSSRYRLLNKRAPFLFEPESPSMKDAVSSSVIDADIITDPNNRIPEGAKLRVSINRYERSPEARQKCLKAKGYSCVVCGMNFEDTYGEIGRDFIHVHHIVPISQIGQSYVIDPIKDLVPVCPNCHAMLHRGPNGVLSVDELKRIMQK